VTTGTTAPAALNPSSLPALISQASTCQDATSTASRSGTAPSREQTSRGARLNGAFAVDCDFTGANFTEATISRYGASTSAVGCDFTGADFTGMNFGKVIFGDYLAPVGGLRLSDITFDRAIAPGYRAVTTAFSRGPQVVVYPEDRVGERLGPLGQFGTNCVFGAVCTFVAWQNAADHVVDGRVSLAQVGWSGEHRHLVTPAEWNVMRFNAGLYAAAATEYPTKLVASGPVDGAATIRYPDRDHAFTYRIAEPTDAIEFGLTCGGLGGVIHTPRRPRCDPGQLGTHSRPPRRRPTATAKTTCIATTGGMRWLRPVGPRFACATSTAPFGATTMSKTSCSTTVSPLAQRTRGQSFVAHERRQLTDTRMTGVAA
jgi:hypothetical protein